MNAWYTGLISLMVLLPLPLRAEEAPVRISYLEGTVVFEHPQEFPWTEVSLNQPLRAGDRLLSGDRSRLEVEFHGGNFLRLGPWTDLILERVSSRDTQVRLLEGELILSLRQGANFLVQTPFAALLPLEGGVFRVDQRGRRGTVVSARRGALEVSTGTRQVTLRAGQVLTLSGPLDPLARIETGYIPDELDFWSDRRDASMAALSSPPEVAAAGYAGLYDLSRFGSWQRLSGYGWVWFPRVGFGWSPYRFGKWVFYPGWGWTWISHEPWGWLPYHCGYWIFLKGHSRWCWVPGGTWVPGGVDFFRGRGLIGWAPRRSGERVPGEPASPGERESDSFSPGDRPGLVTIPEREFLGSGAVRGGSRGHRMEGSFFRPAAPGPAPRRGQVGEPSGTERERVMPGLSERQRRWIAPQEIRIGPVPEVREQLPNRIRNRSFSSPSRLEPERRPTSPGRRIRGDQPEGPFRGPAGGTIRREYRNPIPSSSPSNLRSTPVRPDWRRQAPDAPRASPHRERPQ